MTAAYEITLEQFAKVAKNLPQEAEAAIVKGLRSTTLMCQRFAVEEIDRAKPYPAFDRGELHNSANHTMVHDGGLVHVDAPHAPFIEFGTRPHWPPLEPLVQWVLRKGMVGKRGKSASRSEAAKRGWETRRRKVSGGPSYEEAEARQIARLIQFKIAARGTEPRFFMQKAFRRGVRKMKGEVEHELKTMGISRGGRRR